MTAKTGPWLITDIATATRPTAPLRAPGARATIPALPPRAPRGSGSRTPDDEPAATVRVALDALADLRRPHPAATNGQLVGMLYTAVDRTSGGPHAALAARGAAAVRVACAYLTARDLREAYLALVAAENILTGPPARSETERGRAAS